MKKLILSSVVLAVTVAGWAMSPAYADARKGFYIGAGVGSMLPQNAKVNEVGTTNSAKYDLDPGFATNVAAGYAFGNGFRTELEVAYADVDPSMDSGADVDTLSAMINAIYELPTGGRVRPYIGAGLGVVRTDYDGTEPLTGIVIDDADTKLGVQGIAGVSFQATDQMDLFLDYRYMRTGKLELAAGTSETIKASNKNHILMAGLRYYMGRAAAPEPAPVIAPVPVVQPMEPEPVALVAPEPIIRAYQVYFAWDRYDLDAEGSQIVSSAAASALGGGISRINVTGHTDASGSEIYNMRLSEARALTIREALISNGVDADAITLRSRGETELAVPTPDGQRERRNRRVEIVLP